MDYILNKLNTEQKAAVIQTEGPVIILAGAGSGKTRVLVYRVLYLVLEQKISPTNLLMITFTNKAAGEMIERILKAFAERKISGQPTAGTFHSICAKILRWEGRQIGIPINFQIFDVQDQVETMKEVKAVTVEFEKLKKIFSGLNLGLLHGRQTLKVKNDVLEDFREKKTQILVATPVVEVGIDVANATIMIIEGAERFGLAQLHQLRGRVGRGETKSYCLLFTESHSSTVRTRLVALKGSMSGFELAELDLKMRGPGEFLGTKQHGFPELKIALWTDTELIKKSRAVAQEALDHPEKFPKLIEIIESKSIVPN